DYDQVRDLAHKERPKVIIAGASAYPRTIDFAAFADIAKEVEAVFIVDMAHIAGLVAGGAHPSPVPHADIVTSTAHKTLRGPRSGFVVAKEQYGVPINKQVFPGLQGGPLMHIIAAKAVAFKEALEPSFKTYAKQIVANAQALAAALMNRGYKLVSDGTDNHLLLLSLLGLEITGKAAEEALGRARITVNKNTVPGETRSPFVTSGIRIGTAALTTRGMKEAEFKLIATVMADVLDSPGNETVLNKTRSRVHELCEAHPLYPYFRAEHATVN